MTNSITLADVEAAATRIAPHLDVAPSPLRHYPGLDAFVGHGIRVLVKHEHMLPTGAFKVRNGLSAVTAMTPDDRARGVVGASTGNHGLGLAYAGARLGAPVTICVPLGNNPAKNAAIRALGANIHEEGRDYDEAIIAAQRLCAESGATMVHGVNNRMVVAGAGTMTLEILAQDASADAMFIAIGGGSQAVGAITVARGQGHSLRVVGVQATGASAQHDSWRTKERHEVTRAETFAEGIATRVTYDLTWPTLRDGLADFTLVTDDELIDAMRALITTTRHLPEGAAAAGLAGLKRVAANYAGHTVVVVFCGGNESPERLRQVLDKKH